MGYQHFSTGCNTATDTELRCSACKEWKPDEAYSYSRTAQGGRRNHSSECKLCAAARRRASRARGRSLATLGPDAVLCTRSQCPGAAAGDLTWGRWLHEIPLTAEGRRLLDENGSTPLCTRCLSTATGRCHAVPA